MSSAITPELTPLPSVHVPSPEPVVELPPLERELSPVSAITPELEPVFIPEPELEEEVPAPVEPEPLPEVEVERELSPETEVEPEEPVTPEAEPELEPGFEFEPEPSPEPEGEPEVEPEEVEVERELEPEEPEVTPHISPELVPEEVPEEAVVQVDEPDVTVSTRTSSHPATSVHLSSEHFTIPSAPSPPPPSTYESLWASETDNTYESSILRPSPSVRSIALPEPVNESFESSFMRPTESYISQTPGPQWQIERVPSTIESSSISVRSSMLRAVPEVTVSPSSSRPSSDITAVSFLFFHVFDRHFLTFTRFRRTLLYVLRFRQAFALPLACLFQGRQCPAPTSAHPTAATHPSRLSSRLWRRYPVARKSRPSPARSTVCWIGCRTFRTRRMSKGRSLVRTCVVLSAS